MALLAIIGFQSQKARGSRAVSLAFSAFSLTALKERPGGSISPFCEPATVTSTPHSSCRNSIEPREEMVSTSSSAGCSAASMARRTSSTRVVQPVLVSLWTTQTALMACCRSARRTVSIASGSAPERQSPCRNSGLRPSRSAISRHRLANQPVSLISTRSPGLSVLTSAASHAPVPEAG